MTRTPAEPQQAKPPKRLARVVAGVSMICSVGAGIYGLFRDKRIAIFAFLGIVVAVVLLLIVEQAIKESQKKEGKFFSHLAKALVVFVLLYFIVLMVALFPVLYRWLTSDPVPSQTPNSEAHPSVSPTVPSSEQMFASLGDACKPAPQGCTVFLFDYLRDQISDDVLHEFQNIQADRLDKGIRNHLQEFDLLKGIEFRVARCSAARITEFSLADRAIKILKVPAVMWGFVQRRPDNKLVSTTTITMLDDHLHQVGSREELGDDVTQLLHLARPVKGNPLAIASLIVGDIHLKAGKLDFARKAFLHARDLSAELDANDRGDFLVALNSRLQQLEPRNPAVALRSIAEGDK
jgi:hypothetical protein